MKRRISKYVTPIDIKLLNESGTKPLMSLESVSQKEIESGSVSATI